MMISAFLMHARVNASMTRNKMYRTKVRQNKTGEAVAAQCTCKAGASSIAGMKLTSFLRRILIRVRRNTLTPMTS